jgi:hypothetical protein
MRYIILGVVLLAGCGTTCPTFKATRCNGQLVETCGSNKKWQRAMDCSQVKPIKPEAPTDWACGKTDKGHVCVPGGTK